MAERQDKVRIIPFLRYRDAHTAIGWLCEAFGFERHAVYEDEVGKVAHAELSYGGGFIMLGEMKDDALGMRSPTELGAVNQGIYVVVDDADAHYARARAAGAEIVLDIKDQPYGSRGYTGRDLEGNLWSFGTYAPRTDTD